MEKMYYSNDKINFNNNCFNLIRIVAAFQVMVGHTNEHLKLNIPQFVLKILYLFEGVPIFFGISGYLIWNSVKRESSIKKYLKQRVLLNYPELWLGVILSIVSILILYQNKINYVHLVIFIFTQSTFLQFWTPGSLRNFGCGVPNGSLWTIGVIVQFYLLVWIIGKYKKNIKTMQNTTWWIITMSVALVADILSPFLKEFISYEIIGKLYGQTVIPYAFLFLLGCIVCEYKELIVPFLIKTWYVFFIFNLLCCITNIDIPGSYGIVRTTSEILFIIGFAYRFSNINLKHDISYGIYIYHMIVVNIFIEFGLVNKVYFLLLEIFIDIFIASLSYIFIKKLLIKIKNNRKGINFY